MGQLTTVLVLGATLGFTLACDAGFAAQEAGADAELGTATVAGTPVRITFLDVGQADAVLIQAPAGQTALLDAGLPSPTAALRERGVTAIDLLVASHAHADHIGGMTAVLEAFPIRFYMDNGIPHTSIIYRRLLEALQPRPEIKYLNADSRTITLGDATLEVLSAAPFPPSSAIAELAVETATDSLPDAPADTAPWIAADDQNNRSIGLILRLGSFAAFFSGDSEVEQLTWLLRKDAVPDITLLKAPHHGSRNGVTLEYLEVARPEVVVISVGDGNVYGHPHPEALELYGAFADVYRTATAPSRSSDIQTAATRSLPPNPPTAREGERPRKDLL